MKKFLSILLVVVITMSILPMVIPVGAEENMMYLTLPKSIGHMEAQGSVQKREGLKDIPGSRFLQICPNIQVCTL